MAHRRISRAVVLLLTIILIIGIFPQPSLAAGGMNILALADKGTGSQKGSANGEWGHKMAGYRITVIDGAAKPVFKIFGKSSLDILLGTNVLPDMDYFMSGHKFDGEYSIYDNLGAIDSHVIQSRAIYDKLMLGLSHNPQGWKSEIPEMKYYSKTIGQLCNMVSPFERVGKDKWSDHGSDVRKVFYGAGSKISNTALIPVIFNLKTVGANGGQGHYLWQPVAGSFFTEQDCQDVRNNKISPASLMNKRGVVIEIEPIIWNRLRERYGTTSDFTFGVYGTQSSLGYLIDKLLTTKDKRTKKPLFRPDYNGNMGGVDASLFGRFGRKCMLTNNTCLTFGYKKIGDKNLTVIQPTTGDVPMKSGGFGVSNKEVSTLKVTTQGWSMHAYVVVPKNPGITTTFDQIVPPGTSPGKAPDPHVDPATKDLANIRNLDHYNIVKVYQTRDSVTNVITYDGTFTRELTIPKILIEHETDYLVKEWKYGLPDPDNPVIDGPTGTKWGDDPIKTIVPIESGTKPIPVEVDIANKDDKDEVRTLYVLLERPTKKPLPPPPPPPPAPSTPASNIITESQLVKAISTDRALVGNNWGSYNFSATLEAAVTSHAYTACCGDCRYDQADGATCNHMRRANNDNYVSATTADQFNGRHIDQFNGRQVEPVET